MRKELLSRDLLLIQDSGLSKQVRNFKNSKTKYCDNLVTLKNISKWAPWWLSC